MTHHAASRSGENHLHKLAHVHEHDHIPLDHGGHSVEHERHPKDDHHKGHVTHDSHTDDHDLHQPHDHGAAH